MYVYKERVTGWSTLWGFASAGVWRNLSTVRFMAVLQINRKQYTLYGQQRKICIHCYDATICIPFPTKQNSILGSHCIRAFVLQDSVWCCEMDFWFYAVVPEENEEQFPTGGMLTDILHIQDIEIFGSQKHYDCPLLIYMHIFFIKRWRKSHLYDK